MTYHRWAPLFCHEVGVLRTAISTLVDFRRCLFLACRLLAASPLTPELYLQEHLYRNRYSWRPTEACTGVIAPYTIDV